MDKKIIISDKYPGWKDWFPSSEQLENFYQSGRADIELNENQFLLIHGEDGEIVDKRCFQKGVLRPIKYTTCENLYTGKIRPRNDYQALAMDMLADQNVKIKVLRGVYGSGKDFLMLSQALSFLRKDKFQKIVYLRPNVIVKDLPDIGYLPGDSDDKLAWTLGPIVDKLGGDMGVSSLIHAQQLEVVPIIHIRGRSFENSIIYVSEGQNMTTEIAKLIIGRVGENSELWINGDTHQSDRKIFDTDNGINKMVERLRGNRLFSYVYLPITERSEVANLANLLDD